MNKDNTEGSRGCVRYIAERRRQLAGPSKLGWMSSSIYVMRNAEGSLDGPSKLEWMSGSIRVYLMRNEEGSLAGPSKSRWMSSSIYEGSHAQNVICYDSRKQHGRAVCRDNLVYGIRSLTTIWNSTLRDVVRGSEIMRSVTLDFAMEHSYSA